LYAVLCFDIGFMRFLGKKLFLTFQNYFLSTVCRIYAVLRRVVVNITARNGKKCIFTVYRSRISPQYHTSRAAAALFIVSENSDIFFIVSDLSGYSFYCITKFTMPFL